MNFWPEPEFVKAKINFNFHQVKFPFPEKKLLRKWLKHVFEEEDKRCGELTYIFCTDGYLLDINKRFLDHDYYTDIITFPLADDPVSGEIYISWDRVVENATTQKVTSEHEMLRVMVHGVLHLCGYEDDSAAKKQKMRKLETAYVDAFYRLSEG